ncbi:hypothetical protein [Ammoniphilus resinae]|uniref:DNA-binding transcriptional regulator GbsR (MarR family) n=1 Tax=Ammoniphilus resinae TaxID=861532 RepID=A0ABS4GSM5_9BACL|nr:hypothetical protein [Ammoniphilus resinae]MBP1933132.1 DNA-binding transcriptional regulator GbsR (MarR family) [Ammoniphilus resinae]
MTEHICEVCKEKKGDFYSSFELESWGIIEKIGEKNRTHYYLCIDCFNRLTDAPLFSEEARQKILKNKEEYQKAVEEGLVCPECKAFIMEKPHRCGE